jgi:two-component system, OmpR family, response regulator MprA
LADLLIVDDDADLVEALTDVLTIEGYRLRRAPNGAEGLCRLLERVPDLVLLDVNMAVLDGPGMALQMSLHGQGWEKIPILLMSAAADLSGIARRLGIRHFLAKPFSLLQLTELLDRVLVDAAADAAAPAKLV